MVKNPLDLATGQGTPKVAPGVFDALSARLSSDAGFEIVYMSGGSVSMALLGRPDAELMGMSEMAGQAAHIAAAVDVPVIADADTGFGNAMSVERTVRAYEAAGVAGLHIEDQESPKRCGQLAGKRLVAPEVFAVKLRAAVRARSSDGIRIIARTDARSVGGMREVIERAKRYAAEGVDMIFPEALKSVDEVHKVHAATGLPVLVNQVPLGPAPVFDHTELYEAGCRVVIYPSVLMSASVLAMESSARLLKQGRLDATPLLAPIDLFERVGLTEWLKHEEEFAIVDPDVDAR